MSAFIVVEQRNGCAFPYNAFVCLDETDFIEQTRNTAAKSGVLEVLNTAADCVAWLDERYAQRTFIVSEQHYREHKTISVVIERAASRLGWNT